MDRNSLRPFGADNERSVNIRFVVTEDGRVSIKVYALSGVFVKQLVDDTFTKGIHWSKWDGTNRDGQRVASGVYLITTTMPNQQKTIEALKEAGLRDGVKVMIGGAPTTRAWADEIGADGYAEDAIAAVTAAKALLGVA